MLTKPNTLPALLLLALLLSQALGCAFTRMETARQLEANDVVLAGTLDWPGALYIPRAGFYAMYGVGGVGDISVHASTSLLTFHAGAGGRAYLGEYLILSLQSEAFVPLINDGMFVGDNALLTFTPRLMSSAAEHRLVYGGVQSNLLTGIGGNNSAIEPVGALIGGFVGFDHWSPQSGIGIQAEGIVLPFSVDQDGLNITGPDSDLGFIGLFQVSIGLYFRTPQRVEIQRQLEPSPYYEVPDPDRRDALPPRPPREPMPQPQPEPEPEYDDQGVPLY